MTDIRSINEIIQCATLEIPKGTKNAISISFAFSFDFLIRNVNFISKEHKTQNHLN